MQQLLWPHLTIWRRQPFGRSQKSTIPTKCLGRGREVLGSLDSHRVLLLTRGDVEIPSDLDGIEYYNYSVRSDLRPEPPQWRRGPLDERLRRFDGTRLITRWVVFSKISYEPTTRCWATCGSRPQLGNSEKPVLVCITVLRT